MTTQIALFDADTIASPLCMYEHCRRKGRAVLGPPWHVSEHCVNRTIECLTCGARGEQSDNLLLKRRTVAA